MGLMLKYLHLASILKCSHGGIVQFSSSPKRSFVIQRSPILTASDLLQAVIVGCPQVGVGVKPCTKVVQILVGRAQEILVDGEIPLLEHLQAITDGSPPGICSMFVNNISNVQIGAVHLDTTQAHALRAAHKDGAFFCAICEPDVGRSEVAPHAPSGPGKKIARHTILVVTVVDRLTGQPLEGVAVSLAPLMPGSNPDPQLPPAMPPRLFSSNTTTDSLGQVRFEEILPLEYTIWASREGYGSEYTRTRVVEGQTREVGLPLAPHLIVIAHGWPGKEPTRGFEFAARTKLQDAKANRRGEVWFAGLRATKAAFRDLFDTLRTRDQQVQELHVYSHSGETDGPIFRDGQFLGAEVRDLALARWTPNARAYFYGCLTAYGYFAPLFALHQNVTVCVSVGYTSFSARADEFSPLPEFAMQSPPVYQASFLTIQEMRRRRFDYDTDRRPVAWDTITLVRFAGGLPIATEVLRNYTLRSGVPPLPMVEIPPRSRPRFLREFSGRGDKLPTFEPRQGAPIESVP